MTDFALALAVHSSRAGPMTIQIGPRTYDAIALDVGGVDDVTRRDVICRLVFRPEAIPEIFVQLVAALDELDEGVR